MRRMGWQTLLLPGLVGVLLGAAGADWTAPVGKPLPAIVGDTLSGHPIVMPRDLAGRPALLLIGFTRDSQGPVEAWVHALAGIERALPVFQIPMIGNGIGARLARPLIDGGMRSGTPKAQHDHIVTVYTDLRAIRSGLGVLPAVPVYAVLVGRSGRIAGAWAGAPSAPALAELRSRVQQL